MKLSKGLQVKINTGKGIVNGIVSDFLELQGVNYWWVQLTLDYHHEVNIYLESDILAWNKEKKECDCGAKKLDHPGHVYWCQTND